MSTPVTVLKPSGLIDVLVTIHPEHAAKIYKGQKSFELRKTAPRTLPRRMFLYETGHVKAITGFIVVERVLVGSPPGIWDHTGEAATSRERFDNYYAKSDAAVAFEISNAVQFAEPVSIAELRTLDEGFRLPQNFLYLDNYQKVQSLLSVRALSEVLSDAKGVLRFRALEERDAPRFKAMIKKHIEGSYLETGVKYANKLLEVGAADSDPEGIFTLRKRVLKLEYQRKFAGFLVLTEKQGGCIKTGPVMLTERLQNKGIGAKMRAVLAKTLSKAGFRKIYCTAPATNKAAVSYLISSGYRVEAHLKNPYHHKHDELVFGFKLREGAYIPPETFRQIDVATQFERVTEVTPDVAPFVAQLFPEIYSHVDWQWVSRQVQLAQDVNAKEDFKPRMMYAARGLQLVAVALCTLKRGGGIKILILTQTAHQRSLSAFLDHIESDIRHHSSVPVRRFYSLVPVTDVDVFSAFRLADYQVEGVIESPYREGVDMFALGKLTGNKHS